ncbi:macrosialin-like isoform X1 [Scleropages formosus]|uniref:macrosialin-like isoform X1 n=1 Tax=Scleropages formosus TaxID=113540 RepID=UPI0010FA9FD5|nr:macrosialin isoform X1 [Scleropages formosus]
MDIISVLFGGPMVTMRRTRLRLLTMALALSLVIAISFSKKRTSVHVIPPTAPYLYTLPYGHRPVFGGVTSIPETASTMKMTTVSDPSSTMEDGAYNWKDFASSTVETASGSEEQTSATKMSYTSEELASTTEESTSTMEGPVSSKFPYPWEELASTTTETSQMASTVTAGAFASASSTTLTEVPTTMNASTTAVVTEALPTKSTPMETTPSKVLSSTAETASTILTEGHATTITGFTTGTRAPSITKTAYSTMATTTPAAGPTPPELVVGNYTIERKGGILCVKAEMALQIRVTYRTIFKNESEGIFTIQPSRTVAVGGCGETTATLHLKFDEGVIFFRFQKNTTTNTVYVSTVSVLVTITLPNADPKKRTYTAKNESVQLFSAQLCHSYACNQQSVSMGQNLTLEVFQQRIQALDFTGPAFGPEDPCPVVQGSSNLAMILCILLLVLIVAVAVACFIWRRKKLEGYQPL